MIRPMFEIPENHLHNQRFITVHVCQMTADQVILPVQFSKRLYLDKPEAVCIVCRPVIILLVGIRLFAKIQFQMICVFEFKAKVGSDGRMFGSVSPKQIEEGLKEQWGITIDKRKFIDKYPANGLGYTRLKIELYKGEAGEVVGTVNVHISEE